MSNSSRTELQGSNSNRVESSRTIKLFKLMVSKMTVLADFLCNFFLEFFPPKKTYFYKNNSKFGNFCLNFKFANFLSNFKHLLTSHLRYKNSNFRTRSLKPSLLRRATAKKTARKKNMLHPERRHEDSVLRTPAKEICHPPRGRRRFVTLSKRRGGAFDALLQRGEQEGAENEGDRKGSAEITQSEAGCARG